MKIRTLSPHDADALLAFELANRAWFEANVEARPARFYCDAGVAHHIANCLAKYEAGTMHPCLLEDDGGAIIGRANLKDIDAEARRAEIGYRIALHACGRGLASLALQHMLAQAYGRWALASVDAYVTVNNPASARVLAKQGFQLLGIQAAHAEVGGQSLDCHHFRHTPQCADTLLR